MLLTSLLNVQKRPTWIKGHGMCIAVRVHYYGKLMHFVPCPQFLWVVISMKGGDE